MRFSLVALSLLSSCTLIQAQGWTLVESSAPVPTASSSMDAAPSTASEYVNSWNDHKLLSAPEPAQNDSNNETYVTLHDLDADPHPDWADQWSQFDAANGKNSSDMDKAIKEFPSEVSKLKQMMAQGSGAETLNHEWSLFIQHLSSTYPSIASKLSTLEDTSNLSTPSQWSSFLDALEHIVATQ